MSTVIDRRRFLQGTAGLAAVALSAVALDACGSNDDDAAGPTGATGSTTAGASSPATSTVANGSSSTTGASKDSLLPAYVADDKVTPDLPGTADGVASGFLAYPQDPPKVTEGTPGRTSAVSAFLMTPGALPPPVGSNKFWQELNKRLGVDFKANLIPASEYTPKVAAMVGSGDVPELTQISASSVPNLPEALKAMFTDLTEYLGGDAVKAYPCLAALPTIAWQSTVYNKGIYGIPFPLGVAGSYAFTRKDLFAELGAPTEISSGEDLKKLFTTLTDVKKNRYASCQPTNVLAYVQTMLGAPNAWKLDDGKFVSAYETDEYAQGLDIVSQMWKDGVLHPDSFAGTIQFKAAFGGGQVAMAFDGYSAWPGYVRDYGPDNPKFALDVLIPPKWDGGGQAGQYLGKGSYTFLAIKKGTAERTKELLDIVNWFAAPFGSEEYLFKKYGIAGHDYTLKGADPILTATGTNEMHLPTSYVANPAPFLYEPGLPDVTRQEYAIQQKLVPSGVQNPAVGLVSPTDTAKGRALAKPVGDAINDIIQGRKPVSSWSDVVTTWRNSGGSQVAAEFADAYAALHG
jgi:putative aldouronate transport system substrate-binding protein